MDLHYILRLIFLPLIFVFAIVGIEHEFRVIQYHYFITKLEVTRKFQVGDCIRFKDDNLEEWELLPVPPKRQIMAVGNRSYEVCSYENQCADLLNLVPNTPSPESLPFSLETNYDKIQCNNQ